MAASNKVSFKTDGKKLTILDISRTKEDTFEENVAFYYIGDKGK